MERSPGPPVSGLDVHRPDSSPPPKAMEALALQCTKCQKVSVFSSALRDSRPTRCRYCQASLIGVPIFSPREVGAVIRASDKRINAIIFFCASAAAGIAVSYPFSPMPYPLLISALCLVFAAGIWRFRLGRFVSSFLYFFLVAPILFFCAGTPFVFFGILGLAVLGMALSIWREMLVDMS